MKKCSLNSFIDEIKPWLSGDYISKAEIVDEGRFTLHFLNGTMNVYKIDNCTKNQVEKICEDLIEKGIVVENI